MIALLYKPSLQLVYAVTMHATAGGNAFPQPWRSATRTGQAARVEERFDARASTLRRPSAEGPDHECQRLLHGTVDRALRRPRPQTYGTETSSALLESETEGGNKPEIEISCALF